MKGGEITAAEKVLTGLGFRGGVGLALGLFIGHAGFRKCVLDLFSSLLLTACGWGGQPYPQQTVLGALTDRLVVEEDYREHVYKDTEGHATIGYGFNLDAGMPEPLARIVLRWQADANIAEFRRLWPPFDAQPFDVKVALADMAFQLGPAGAAGFGDMLDAVERGDWEAAAKAARDSAWDRETPARVERVVAAFEAQDGR